MYMYMPYTKIYGFYVLFHKKNVQKGLSPVYSLNLLLSVEIVQDNRSPIMLKRPNVVIMYQVEVIIYLCEIEIFQEQQSQ